MSGKVHTARFVVRALLSAFATGLVVVCTFVTPACSDANSHIYSGRPYDPTRDCLGDNISIDVVNGSSATFNCDAVCLYNSDDGIGYFVSSECPPYPTFYKVNPAGTDCDKALAAVTRQDICNPDGGGSSNPLEAGAPMEAGATTTDASTDAGHD